MKTAYLTGDTYPVREKLKTRGWKWDAEQKAWTKTADWGDPEDVVNTVRSYGGIRNRGSFSATIKTN